MTSYRKGQLGGNLFSLTPYYSDNFAVTQIQYKIVTSFVTQEATDDNLFTRVLTL